MPSMVTLSSPRPRRFSAPRCLLALVTCLLASSACSAATALPETASASSSSMGPHTTRLAIISPAFGAATTGNNVKVSVELWRQENPSDLTVKLNGHDISSRLHSSSCKANSCIMSATVSPQDGLKTGQNLLWASVKGEGRTPGAVQRSRFSYGRGKIVGHGENTVQYYEPASIGIGANLTGIEIVTGSIANVSDPIQDVSLPDGSTNISIPYPDVQYSANCTTALQAIALDRAAPSVEKGTACGDSAGEVLTNLADSIGTDLDATDLVILGTTAGNIVPKGFDTTSLGGTNYFNFPSNLYPQEYLIIGVPGANAGTAHENYDVTKGPDTPYQYDPFFAGTLMLDQNGNFNYAPGDNIPFQVSSVSGSVGISVYGQTYSPPASGGQGSFWLLVLDRQLLAPINYPSIGAGTWTNCAYEAASQACGGIFNVRDDGGMSLSTTLLGISPRNLIFLVAQGCPFDPNSVILLGDAVGRLGGIRYSLSNLNSSANTCAYSLYQAIRHRSVPFRLRIARPSLAPLPYLPINTLRRVRPASCMAFSPALTAVYTTSAITIRESRPRIMS
jgi:hypothetical protein